MYGDPDILKFMSVRVKVHEYLRNTLDYSTRGEVKMDIRKYVKYMIGEFPVKVKNPRR